MSTSNGEKAKVTNAFEAKLMNTAILKPRPLNRKGKISDIISQPIGPNDNCKDETIIRKTKQTYINSSL